MTVEVKSKPKPKPRKYFVDIEGETHEWDRDTITVPEIRNLAGWDANQQVMEVDLQHNSERTLGEDAMIKLKPGRGFSKKIRFQRG